MKKIILGISLITFVMFVFSYNTNANTLKQDKQKVAVEKKAAKDGDHKCCAGDKKADAKCCKDGKKDASCNHDKAKAEVKCDKSKPSCAKTCTDKKKTEPKQ